VGRREAGVGEGGVGKGSLIFFPLQRGRERERASFILSVSLAFFCGLLFCARVILYHSLSNPFENRERLRGKGKGERVFFFSLFPFHQKPDGDDGAGEFGKAKAASHLLSFNN
jgi:hypothetical protein